MKRGKGVVVLMFLLFGAGVSCFSQDNSVRVYSWYRSSDMQKMIVAEYERSDNELIQAGYKDKTYLFDAHTSRCEGCVAINKWTHPVSKRTISVKDGDYSDEELYRRGYRDKQLQFYVLNSHDE